MDRKSQVLFLLELQRIKVETYVCKVGELRGGASVLQVWRWWLTLCGARLKAAVWRFLGVKHQHCQYLIKSIIMQIFPRWINKSHPDFRRIYHLTRVKHKEHIGYLSLNISNTQVRILNHIFCIDLFRFWNKYDPGRLQNVKITNDQFIKRSTEPCK